MRTAVAEPDDGVGMGQDLSQRLVVDIVLGLQQAGFELLLDSQIEEGVDDPLALFLGDLADRFELHPLVLFERRLVDPHVVPPRLREADRALRLVDDGLVVQFGADFGVGVEPQLLLVRHQEDRVPGRQAAEHLAVLHREVLRDPVRAAHRVGADAERRGLLDPRHVHLPFVRLAHRLRQAVVNDGAAGRLGEAADHAVLQFDVLAAAGLDRPGAHLTQHVA